MVEVKIILSIRSVMSLIIPNASEKIAYIRAAKITGNSICFNRIDNFFRKIIMKMKVLNND
jgi:hypothetical protein